VKVIADSVTTVAALIGIIVVIVEVEDVEYDIVFVTIVVVIEVAVVIAFAVPLLPTCGSTPQYIVCARNCWSGGR
jgi:hypothetical protein